LAKITITDNDGILYTEIEVTKEDIATPTARQLLMDLEMLHDLQLALKNE